LRQLFYFQRFSQSEIRVNKATTYLPSKQQTELLESRSGRW